MIRIDQLAITPGSPCDVSGGSFLSFPHWYQYLPGMADAQGICSPAINGINDVWLVAAATIEILLRAAAIIAVAFVIYAGVQYTTSQGSPEKTGQAKDTLVNAVIGLAVAVLAAATVSFIAKSITA